MKIPAFDPGGKILLLKLRSIGDAILMTPCTRAVKETFPDVHLAVLLERSCADIFRHNPFVDEVIVYSRDFLKVNAGSIFPPWTLTFALWVRKRRFDTVVNLHGGPRSAMLTATSGAANRVGFRDYRFGFIYNLRAPKPRIILDKDGSIHVVERQLSLLEWLGIRTGDKSLILRTGKVEKEAAETFLREKRSSFDHLLIVVHPLSRSPKKRLSDDRYAGLLDSLAGEFGADIVIVGAPGEEEKLARIRGLAKSRSRIHVFCRSLLELAALLERADLFIGTDSGPAHIASAVKTPVVVMYGPSRMEVWHPWGVPYVAVTAGLPCQPCEGDCRQESYLCMEKITVKQIMEACERLLPESTRSGRRR